MAFIFVYKVIKVINTLFYYRKGDDSLIIPQGWEILIIVIGGCDRLLQNSVVKIIWWQLCQTAIHSSP
ncbi:hypothetical protein [Nostoc sp. CCY0012]|uniref:hypothetical protein n=1 Tax=Nostoc sp. CCY0012 TaxID=1056123 RepID=UPI0039C71E1E